MRALHRATVRGRDFSEAVGLLGATFPRRLRKGALGIGVVLERRSRSALMPLDFFLSLLKLRVRFQPLPSCPP